MAIFDPASFLKKIAPPAKIKRLVSSNLTMKKTALNFVDAAADEVDLNKKQISNVALKTIRSYQERRAKASVDAGFEAAAGDELAEEIIDDPKQLIQRVQNEIIFQVHDLIKDKYGGQRATWLPSSAEEPRPEHQTNYGKEYVIGEGIDGVEPGDEYGCQCGVEILDEPTLDLSDESSDDNNGN